MSDRTRESIEVTARFDRQGQATPLNFVWRKRVYPVISTGRRWINEAGQHALVMVPGEKVYDLIFVPGEGRWYLERVGIGRPTA